MNESQQQQVTCRSCQNQHAPLPQSVSQPVTHLLHLFHIHREVGDTLRDMPGNQMRTNVLGVGSSYHHLSIQSSCSSCWLNFLIASGDVKPWWLTEEHLGGNLEWGRFGQFLFGISHRIPSFVASGLCVIIVVSLSLASIGLQTSDVLQSRFSRMRLRSWFWPWLFMFTFLAPKSPKSPNAKSASTQLWDLAFPKAGILYAPLKRSRFILNLFFHPLTQAIEFFFILRKADFI